MLQIFKVFDLCICTIYPVLVSVLLYNIQEWDIQFSAELLCDHASLIHIIGCSSRNVGFPEKTEAEMYCWNCRRLRFIQNCRANGK